MKLAKLFILAIGISLCFYSCNNEDPDVLYNTWNNNVANVIIETPVGNYTYDIRKEQNFNFVITFNEDNTYKAIVEETTQEGSYRVENKKLFINLSDILGEITEIIDLSGFETDMSYSLGKNSLSLEKSYSGEELKTIIDITSGLGGDFSGIPPLDLLQKITIQLKFKKL